PCAVCPVHTRARAGTSGASAVALQGLIEHRDPLPGRREGIMKNFTYYRPKTAQEAVDLLDNRWGNTELLAGGTDLHDLQKEYVAQPTRVVSLGGVNGFAGINAGERGLTIGAGTKLAAIAEHAELRRQYPALASAAGDIGGPQI